MRTILAVSINNLPRSIKKMHQGEPDFDIDLSVNDITILVQHLTPDLAGATRERDAILRFREFSEARHSISRTNICIDIAHVIWRIRVSRRSAEYTSTRDSEDANLLG